MRTVIPALLILTGTLLLGACKGDGRSQPGQVGGCSADTASLDISVEISCDGAASPARISILSVERAEDKTYLAALSELVVILDEIGIGICGIPRLISITEGPCWPRHRIDIRLEEGSEKFFPEIRSALADGMLAGSRPSEERPEGYGLFFVQAAFGSSDRWTLWYGLSPH